MRRSFFKKHTIRFTLADLLLAIALLGALFFEVVVHEFLVENEDNFDFAVFNFFRAHIISPSLTKFMEGVTFFASQNFLPIAYLILIAIFSAKKQWRQALEVLVVGILGSLINIGAKLFYHRLRPSHPLINPAHSFSFPSGHSMSAFIFYGLLIYLVWESKISQAAKWIIAFLLGAFAILIGISRIYLRMHYPSDVIAGFCLGLAWICLAVWFFERIKSKAAKNHSTGSGILPR